MRTVLVLVALVAAATSLPVAPALHQGCVPATATATPISAAGTTLYLHEQGAGHVFVYFENNGLEGLQRDGGCGHRADAKLAEACTRVDTRIPGTVACIVETA